MSKKLPIDLMWENYKSHMVPEEASDMQVSQTKMAFFAGVSATWEATMRTGDMSREGAQRYYADMEANISKYVMEIDQEALDNLKDETETPINGKAH